MTVTRRMSTRAKAWHLGLFRVSVVLVTLVSPEPFMAAEVARGPSSLRFYPEGLSLVRGLLPVTDGAVARGTILFKLAGVLALCGLFTRASLTLFALSTLYLFGVAQLTGEVVHDMHLVWMLALLAVAPSGDGLSVDALLRGKLRLRRAFGPKPRDASYEVPLLFARLLLGIVYFFPGFWKLRASGLAWITSDNVVNQMHWKWAQWGGYVPPIRVDLVPGLVNLGAASVVAFELAFAFVAFVPRTRRALAAGGFVFHQLTQVFFRITFTSLLACYTCLLVPGPGRGPRTRLFTKRTAATWSVGTLLAFAAFFQGARGHTQAYPFACYPTFEYVQPDVMPDVRLEARTPRGDELLPRVARTQSEWGMAWQVSGLWGTPARPEAIEAFARSDLARLRAAGRVPSDVTRVRVLAVRASVVPGNLDAPPVSTRLLGEISP
jgi:hypothetical protein